MTLNECCALAQDMTRIPITVLQTSIVTNIFDFDDIQNAMDKSISDKANIVKAVVKIAEETKV